MIPETKPTVMFCGLPNSHKDGKPYMFHFYRNALAVKMCMGKPNEFPTLKVEVTLSDDFDQTPGKYWGWWDIERQEWCFVFPSRFQVDMCFPYGAKAEEDRGRGKLLPVNIKILEASV